MNHESSPMLTPTEIASINQQRIAAARLYAILDLGYVEPANAMPMARALADGGADIVQLRAKGFDPGEIASVARDLVRLSRDYGWLTIINDHPEIAAEAGASGVHVGQDDQAVARAREVIGSGIVGKSTHSLAQAEAAVREGADYIGFGPLYATGTKPDYRPIGLAEIAQAHQRARIPIFCIGGVNAARLDEVLAAGARRVVIVSGLLLAADVRRCARNIKERLDAAW